MSTLISNKLNFDYMLILSVLCVMLTITDFYRAMLCIRGTSHGPVSVCLCLSVTNRSSTKTAKRRVTKTTPHDSTGTLVL